MSVLIGVWPQIALLSKICNLMLKRLRRIDHANLVTIGVDVNLVVYFSKLL